SRTLDLVPRPHPLHGCGIITPFRILNAWEAQYCSHVEFLQKWVSPTNNQLQGIS
ncbi:6775_t:CDS:1, partial [Funneliformis geosporum]